MKAKYVYENMSSEEADLQIDLHNIFRGWSLETSSIGNHLIEAADEEGFEKFLSDNWKYLAIIDAAEKSVGLRLADYDDVFGMADELYMIMHRGEPGHNYLDNSSESDDELWKTWAYDQLEGLDLLARDDSEKDLDFKYWDRMLDHI